MNIYIYRYIKCYVRQGLAVSIKLMRKPFPEENSYLIRLLALIVPRKQTKNYMYMDVCKFQEKLSLQTNENSKICIDAEIQLVENNVVAKEHKLL